jgi:hypothetical protein
MRAIGKIKFGVMFIDAMAGLVDDCECQILLAHAFVENQHDFLGTIGDGRLFVRRRLYQEGMSQPDGFPRAEIGQTKWIIRVFADRSEWAGIRYGNCRIAELRAG